MPFMSFTSLGRLHALLKVFASVVARTAARVVAMVAAVMLLSGCASNCNILSSSNSRSCDAMLLGGVIIAAPIAVPAVLVSDAVSDAKSRRMAREWQSSMASRLADNDLEAIQECLQDCDIRWQYELDHRVRSRLQLDAAHRFVAGDWPGLTPEDDRVYRLLAYYTLSWQPPKAEGSAEENAPWGLVPAAVRQSHARLQDESVQASLMRLLSVSRFGTMTNTIHAMRFAIDVPLNEVEAQARFSQCPEMMTALMPADESPFMRVAACSRAYFLHFRESAPDELRRQWQASGSKSPALPEPALAQQ